MVDVKSLVEDGTLFGTDPQKVRVIETHISIVCLTGDYVYKFKKPVDFGFLDFSTRENRLHYCKEELRLNRRLSPSLYLGLVGLVQREGGSYEMTEESDDEEKLIEPAVKMKRLSQESLLKERIRHEGLGGELITGLVDVLNGFYREARTNEDIASYGLPDAFRVNLDENFEQTRPYIGSIIPREAYDEIQERTMRFFSDYAWLFQKRVDEGFVKECHGDLHTGNIFVEDEDIYIFDCIEFNERMKNGDVASDIAFLAMDLDFQGYREMGDLLIRRFVKESGDPDLLKVIQFYKSYRAYVRGKVTCFMLTDAEEEKKKELEEQAKRYFELAREYASQYICRPASFDQPVCVLMCGLTASGKSRVSKALSDMLGLERISSDEIRKEMYPDTSQEAYNEGTYSEDRREAVYDRMVTEAQQYIHEGKGCILDASFISQRQREKALAMEGCHHAIVHISIPDDVARQRLEKRKSKLSDGTWEVYQGQKERQDAFTSEEQGFLVGVDGTLRDVAEGAFDGLIALFWDHIT